MNIFQQVFHKEEKWNHFFLCSSFEIDWQICLFLINCEQITVRLALHCGQHWKQIICEIFDVQRGANLILKRYKLHTGDTSFNFPPSLNLTLRVKVSRGNYKAKKKLIRFEHKMFRRWCSDVNESFTYEYFDMNEPLLLRTDYHKFLWNNFKSQESKYFARSKII